jgi:hypothetical protein
MYRPYRAKKIDLMYFPGLPPGLSHSELSAQKQLAAAFVLR